MNVFVAVLVVFSAGLSAGIWLGAWITERAEDAVDRDLGQRDIPQTKATPRKKAPPLPPPRAKVRYAETFPSTTAPDLPRESLPPIPPALLADKRTDVPWLTVDDNGQAVRMEMWGQWKDGTFLYRAVPVDQDGGEG